MALYPETIISLCTGYGGLELGLEIAGMVLFPLAYVERESYAAADLVARMEDASIHSAPVWDCVDTFDAKPLHGVVDGVVGGYPCQPFSVAGRKRGAEDERHLWPHFARIILECEPRWCFFENVPNHLNLGFFEVARELQEMGYTVAATLVTAEEVGASHKRERLFILAYARGEPLRFLAEWREQLKTERRNTKLDDYCTGSMAYADSKDRGCEQQPGEQTEDGRAELGRSNEVFPPGQDANDTRWESWPWPSVESEIRKRLDGHPYWVDELRLNGGGVVPLQAAYAFSLLTADLRRFGA